MSEEKFRIHFKVQIKRSGLKNYTNLYRSFFFRNRLRVLRWALNIWRDREQRKVLLVRGARQVGKTYSVREFGKEFESFLEVNLEEHRDIHSFFAGSLTPQIIVEKLSLYFQQQIIPGETLLFFDEIQACPDAIRALRFFYEKLPDLHVIAAGSLLEFALSEIPSFGVGRIESLFMYPMSFFEFLEAVGAGSMVALIRDADESKPIDAVLHEKLLEYVKNFQLIGGLPEVVATYVKNGSLLQCQEILDSLILSYIDDFAKYRDKIPADILREVFYSIAAQTGEKFKYSNISDKRSNQHKPALDLLVMAGLAYKVYHSSARGLPLGAQVKDNKFKVMLFDSGVYQRMSKLDLSEYVVSDYDTLVNKGNLAENFVCMELIAAMNPAVKPEVYYWHREKRGSNAEIDFVISAGRHIVPIEVKSGTKGRMQSLYLFLEERELERGVRISGENFSVYENITSIPLYAVSNLLKTNWN